MNILNSTLLGVFLLFLPLLLTSQNEYDIETNQSFLALYQAGESYFNEKKLKQAANSFEKAIQLKPDFAATYRRLGATYELMKEYHRAAELYDEALSLDPKMSRTLYFQSGEMHLKNGNYEIAHDRFQSFKSYLNLPAEAFTMEK